MMPVRPIVRLAAGRGDFSECRDQRCSGIKYRVYIDIGLPLEIAHKITENIPEIDEKDENDDQTEKGGCHRGLMDAGSAEEPVNRFHVEDEIDDQIEDGIGK